jgi:putative transposase
MRYPASEKLEIIRTVETSHLPVRRTLDKIGIPKSTFYALLDRYASGGLDALEDHRPTPHRVWNRIPDDVRERIVALALDEPDLSPREVAVAFTDRERSFVSEASVYRLLKARGLVTSAAFIVMKAADKCANPTTAINQLWQTDFTYLKVTGWGWFYLSTVLDDFSRYIVAWKLCTTMSADDVTDTLDLALQASGLDDAPPERRPRLLSDNGPSYVASDLSDWLQEQGMKHTRGKPYHPMTQGKIERWHLSLKSRILLENYHLAGELERAVTDFVEHYNHRRYHESLDNLTPANVYFGKGSMAGASVLAHVIMAKYADHLPLYRQAEIYARDGLDRGTPTDRMGKAAWLLRPLAERIGEHVMAGTVIHADDTPVPVLAPGNGKTRTGRLWLYLRDERPHAGPAPPAVLYRYTPDRKGERCREHLSSFCGHLHADGYAGFAELYESAAGRPANVTEVACWAHVRRKFFDVHKANGSPIAHEALERIGALFEIERTIAGKSAEQRCCRAPEPGQGEAR